MVPALPPLRGWKTVPGDIQRLQMTLASIDQVLLQRIMPKGISDGVNAGLTVLTHGCYPVASIAFEKARVDPVKADHDIVEITQQGLVLPPSCWSHYTTKAATMPNGIP